MKYWVNKCTSKRHQERGRLVIIHVRRAAFCFLMSLLFYVFLLFVGYGIWCVVLHGMSTPKLEVDGGTLFQDFLCWCDAGFVGERKEGVCWREEINTWWWGKLSTLVFSLKFFLQFNLFVLKTLKRNAWSFDFE